VKENSYGTKAEADKITPRIGISYSIDDNTSVYGLYDQSFVPQAGFFRTGGIPKPITGNNMEVGVKETGSAENGTLHCLYTISKEILRLQILQTALSKTLSLIWVKQEFRELNLI
jgi:iron complex outermembrane receptor protein